MHEVLRHISVSGLSSREGCGNTVRNVTGDPFAGVLEGEIFDPSPWAGAFVRYWVRNELTQLLPRKCKVAFSGYADIINATTTAFNRSSCPDAAKVGQVTLDSPDYGGPLLGNVWLVDRAPPPWFAVDFTAPALGNPTGVTFPQLTVRTNLVQVDPACDPATDPAGYCPLRITLLLAEMPDVSTLQLTFTIDGPDRAGAAMPLSGKLFQFDGTCDTVSTSASLTPVSGGAISLSTPPVLPPCTP